MKTTHGPRSLRKLLIYPKFQLLVLGINLGAFTLVTLCQWLFILNTLDELRPAAGLSGMPVEYFKRYLAYETAAFEKTLLITFLIGFTVSAVLTLVLSHRISGPLVRLRNYFMGISSGEEALRELSFRDGDYLSDIPPAVNAAISKIREREREENRAA